MLPSLLPLLLVAPSPSLAPTQAQEPGASGAAPLFSEISVIETYRSNGDEPFYWAVYSRNRFRKGTTPNGITRFEFEPREADARIGDSVSVEARIESDGGVLVVEQDVSSKILRVGVESAITDLLNRRISTIEPWEGEIVTDIVPFDSTLLPNVEAGSVPLSCYVEPVVIDGVTYQKIRYQIYNHAFTVGSAEARMDYRGMAIIEPVRGTLYHSFFMQRGTVTNGEKTSQVDHAVTSSLMAVGLEDEVALLLPAAVEDEISAFTFFKQAQVDGLDPEIARAEVRPDWSVDLWVTGRVTEMTAGMIAEQGTNPLPAVALGSMVLTDEAIRYSESQLWRYENDFYAFAEPGDEPAPALTEPEILSPLEKAFGAVPFGERLGILPPQTDAVLRFDGTEIFPVGLLVLMTEAEFGSSASRLAFTGSSGSTAVASSTPIWPVVTNVVATSSLLGSGALIGAGVLIVGGGAAVGIGSDSSGSGGTSSSTTARLEYSTAFSQGCNSGSLELIVVDAEAPRTWRISGDGTFTVPAGALCQSSPDGTPWADSEQGSTAEGVALRLTLTIPPHACLDGTVTVTVNGAPVEITFGGQSVPSGQVSRSCF